ncbi:aminoacyl-tRNA hydrolase [Corynebacterium heidelbergense]|uniref:Peptidyl-tRNA hydrolase n=1 Tax=Corynebacterium heidelbergense TaxID=2055947 RepID=A0A364V478_9CORY|nr:aminoacyl-tRNA hydrolase [Corynebacterium heidelbergense]
MFSHSHRSHQPRKDTAGSAVPPTGTPPAAKAQPWLVVGLGNPGAEYASTRHNVGYMTLDELLGDLSPMPGTLSTHRKTNSQICQTRLSLPGGSSSLTQSGSDADGPVPVILARTRTYMNTSGGPIAALAKFFKIPPERTIVIHDELDLDPGTVRLKVGGGENGHNGLKSTSQALGTRDYVRIRIGIGRPPGRMDVSNFVLKPFTKAEQEWLPVALGNAADAVRIAVVRGVPNAQNEIHPRT